MGSELLERYKAQQKEREEAQKINPLLQGNSFSGKGRYYWIWGHTIRGRPFMRGVFSTLQEAEQAEYQIADAVNTHIVALNTKDSDEASRQIKPLMADETHSLDDALRRMKRKVEVQ